MNVLAEESLREAACVGDFQAVKNLISQNVNLNSKNSINEWTPLHWACKRGHVDIVKYLIANGANITITNSKGETPVSVCTNTTVLSIFGIHKIVNCNPEPQLKFVPNYIKNPPLNPKIKLEFNHNAEHILKKPKLTLVMKKEEPFLLLVRIADAEDNDYVVLEVLKSSLTFESLVKICAKELNVPLSRVIKLRSYPWTIQIRNDNDVKRLKNEEKLELVIRF